MGNPKSSTSSSSSSMFTPFATRNSAIADKPRDAFRGQSRLPNMVPFDMLAMVSYECTTVTLSLRQSP